MLCLSYKIVELFSYFLQIVFASFLANMIVDGIIFTAGQGFQPAWIESYEGTTEGGAAWVVSLLSGCYLLVGKRLFSGLLTVQD